MKIRTRIILTFVLLVGVGFYFLTDWILKDLRPRYLESVEEVLVDTSHLLAAFLETEALEGRLQTETLKKTFDEISRHSFSAKIYDLTKRQVDLNVYVTDERGRVIFDSQGGKEEGKDYSLWNDVFLALKGQYGTRTTRADPTHPASTVLYVAAPIRWKGKIIGAVTVAKPTASINLFIQSAKPEIMIAGLIAALSVILLGIVVSSWIAHPIQKLIVYARAVRDGRRATLPALGKNEIGEMGRAFEEMREALEGKNYVEHYVQTLTHELKSPLSAVRGASELLEEEMPTEQRNRFLKNIHSEVERMQQFIERMLELTALENQKQLRKIERVDLKTLLLEVLTRLESLIQQKNIRIEKQKLNTSVLLLGEKFLLEQAFTNLVQNAIEFSPEGGKISFELTSKEQILECKLSDEGPGIPDYALPKVFDKFFSLPRPPTGKKSTGLGLSFVKEVVELHQGVICLRNREPQGLEVVLEFPILN